MATDEALVYVVALSVPVWLLVEHVAMWLKALRPNRDRLAVAVPEREMVTAGAPETRRAA
jgi:hypothetical protein